MLGFQYLQTLPQVCCCSYNVVVVVVVYLSYDDFLGLDVLLGLSFFIYFNIVLVLTRPKLLLVQILQVNLSTGYVNFNDSWAASLICLGLIYLGG